MYKINAFTLIELLVVIVIIGILATLSVATWRGNIDTANEGKKVAEDAQELQRLVAECIVQERDDCHTIGLSNATSFEYKKCSDYSQSWNHGPLTTYNMDGTVLEDFADTPQSQNKARAYCDSVCDFGYYWHSLGSDYVSGRINHYCQGSLGNPPQVICGRVGNNFSTYGWVNHTHNLSGHPLDLGNVTSVASQSIVEDFCTTSCASSLYGTFASGSVTTYYYCQ